MAFHNSGRIVTSGLVLSLDAADRNSYVSGSTTWFDLSGNNNTGSLVNGPTFSSANGGSIVFDGSSSYVTGSTSANFAFGTSDFSINYWVYFSNFSGSATTPTMVDFRTVISGQGPGYSDYIQSNKYKLYWSNSDRYTSTGSINTGSWYNIAVVRSSTVGSVYINSILDGTFSDNTNLTENALKLARNVNAAPGTSYLNGRLANVLIYKGKALSAQEVRQNYDAMKSRFNLT